MEREELELTGAETKLIMELLRADDSDEAATLHDKLANLGLSAFDEKPVIIAIPTEE